MFMQRRKGTKPPSKKFEASRIKTYSVDEIFDFMSKNPDELFYVDEAGNRCKLRRAKVFHIYGTKCANPNCKTTGTFFALEKWPVGDIHFELYGIDETGDEVLMTVDHVQPKSKGGLDHISNYQPMCKVCNEIKSNHV